MILLDKLAYSSSLRHRSPGLKSAWAVGVLLISVGAQSIFVSTAAIVVMGFLSLKFCSVSLPLYCKLMAAPFAFLAIGTVAVVLNISPLPLDLWNLPLGSFYLSASRSSVMLGVRLIFTALAGVSCLYFLTLTTPLTDLLAVLRKLHCPWIVLELMLLIYRFLFVLLDIAQAILESQNCRLGNRDFKTSLKSMGQLLAVLFVRAMEKASTLYDSMESRLFDGEIRVLDETHPAKALECVCVFAGLAVFALLAWIHGIGIIL